jgi:hypothetical protein
MLFKPAANRLEPGLSPPPAPPDCVAPGGRFAGRPSFIDKKFLLAHTNKPGLSPIDDAITRAINK